MPQKKGGWAAFSRLDRSEIRLRQVELSCKPLVCLKARSSHFLQFVLSGSKDDCVIHCVVAVPKHISRLYDSLKGHGGV